MNPEGKILVIGYGNEMRGDDGVGPMIVGMVEAWHLDGVQTIVRQQLTPELADPIAQARAVIFVDASLEVAGENAQTLPLTPAKNASFVGHTEDPRLVLALAQSVYGRVPQAWCIHVPAASFETGAMLSAQAEHGFTTALYAVREIYHELVPAQAEKKLVNE